MKIPAHNHNIIHLIVPLWLIYRLFRNLNWTIHAFQKSILWEETEVELCGQIFFVIFGFTIVTDCRNYLDDCLWQEFIQP